MKKVDVEGIRKQKGKRRAIAVFALRPGIAPTKIPRNVPNRINSMFWTFTDAPKTWIRNSIGHYPIS